MHIKHREKCPGWFNVQNTARWYPNTDVKERHNWKYTVRRIILMKILVICTKILTFSTRMLAQRIHSDTRDMILDLLWVADDFADWVHQVFWAGQLMCKDLVSNPRIRRVSESWRLEVAGFLKRVYALGMALQTIFCFKTSSSFRE